MPRCWWPRLRDFWPCCAAPAGMDRPARNLIGAPAIVERRARALVGERVLDAARHLAGQGHLEAGVADLPLDQFGGLLELHREEVAHLQSLGRACYQRRGSAIAELELGEQGFELLRVLQVQRAELDGDRQHPRLRLGADDMKSGAERRDRGVTAHEADQGPLDAVQAELARDDLVDPRRHEAGAAGHDQMGDAVQRGFVAQLRDGAERQLRRILGIDLHAPRGGRRRAMIEGALFIVRTATRRRSKHRPAMLEPAPVRHAQEQLAHALVLDLALGPVDEQAVHVMLRNDAREGVDIGASLTHACGPFGSDAPVCRSTATPPHRSVARAN